MKDTRQKKASTTAPVLIRFLDRNAIRLLAVVCAGYLILLVLLTKYQEVITWDGVYYASYTMDSVFPPGYPALIKVAQLLVAEPQNAGTTVSILCMSGSVLMVFFIGHMFVSAGYSLIGAMIFAFNPLSLRLGVVVLSESSYVFFLLAALFFFGKGIKDPSSPYSFIVSGILVGCSFITRPEAVVTAIVVCAGYLFFRKRLRPVALFLGGFAAVVLVSNATLAAFTGEFALTKKTSNFRIAYTSDEWQKNEQLKTGSSSVPPPTKQQLASWIAANYTHNLMLESTDLVAFYGVPLVLIGLVSIALHRSFLLAALAQFFVYPIFSGLGGVWRFVFPYLAIFVIVSMESLEHRVKGNWKFILLLLMVLGPFAKFSFVTQSEEPFVELKEAGIALRTFVNDTTLIMDRKPYTAFYAGLKSSKFIETPYLNIGDLYAFAKEHRVTYFVASRRMTEIFRPMQLGLFDARERSLWATKFERLLSIYEGTEWEVIVFKVV